jgi:hypothetical protein
VYTTLIAAVPGDEHLLEALGSVYGQSLAPERVEVITDRGVDVSAAWRAEIVDRHPSVVFTTQPGTGMISALNHGIEAIETPYVAFLDCDDLWLPNKQEMQIALLEKNESLHAVSSRAVNVIATPSGSVAEQDPRPACMFTATTFRTDTFRTFGLIDPTASHHTWLYRWWARARDAGIRTTAIEKVGLERRIHSRNSWVVDNQEAHANLLAEIRSITATRRKEDHDDSARD